MRFAFLTELSLPHVDGQEVFFQELAEAMVRRGHGSTCTASVTRPASIREEVMNGVRIRRNPLNKAAT